jgi:hypothetical protein
MKTTPLLLAFMSLFAGSIYASTEEQQIVDAVRGVFTALSTEDTAKFDSVTIRDFYVFEGGTRFNKDAIMSTVRRYTQRVKDTNGT